MDKLSVIKHMTVNRPLYRPFIPELKFTHTKQSNIQSEITNLISNTGIHAIIKGGRKW